MRQAGDGDAQELFGRVVDMAEAVLSIQQHDRDRQRSKHGSRVGPALTGGHKTLGAVNGGGHAASDSRAAGDSAWVSASVVIRRIGAPPAIRAISGS